MSLRNRLLSAILLALLISFSLGAVAAMWQARRGVQAEQTAALANARQATLAAMAGLPGVADRAAELRRIVRAFDGNRHVRASLVTQTGAIAAASAPEAAPATPAWLSRLIVPSLKPATLPVPDGGADAALRLESEPLNEAAERWGELRARVAGFAAFFLLSGLLCSLTATRSLRPLTLLAQAMDRVGRGEAAPALAVSGPVETALLARAFNDMAAALRAAQVQNGHLSQRIVVIAQEERADIARDLHDEIGPLLFAITTFAAVVGRQVETGDLEPVRGQLAAIQHAVGQLQGGVREMLGRLREGDVAAADLETALTELLAFWRSMRPETRFSLALNGLDDGLADAARDCLYRAAQEGISNAIRHGNATSIDLDVVLRQGEAEIRVRDNGAGGPEGPGSGLPGMRARAASLGGQVQIVHGAGWDVTVRVPARLEA
jgi:two-component system sensor histidine kinase UhpB